MNEPRPRILRDLLADVAVISPAKIPEIIINGVVFDSRQVQPGDCFIALSGGSADGHRYINLAIKNGAAAVVGMQPGIQADVPYIQVADTRHALALISAAFHGYPGRSLFVIGVTGTDGKTTTSNMIYQILLAAGLRVGIISTVNAVIGSEEVDTGFHVTTPEAPDVQRYLSRMLAAGLTHVVLEATSHGLAQERVTACEFDLGVVTNITHEHLDYHGSYEAYREAKSRLFTGLADTAVKTRGNLRAAILNLDDSSYEYMRAIAPGPQVTYSTRQRADYYVKGFTTSADGMTFDVHTTQGAFPFKTHLVGEYNISNCLAAIAATVGAMGLPMTTAQAGITALEGVPGRMELINLGQNFTAIVDFAHTPNALQRALETARTLTNGKVIAVFGSAGLRDREKRRMMAETSVDLADISILTAEDPRTESLDGILAEMARGAESHGAVEGKTFFQVPDRGDAIRTAVRMAKPGDLVIACGKGHEQSMCFGETEYPWDDRTAMKAALAELLGIPGVEMPYLPTQETKDT
ncbi:MAG: UDP-N-acetylmuramoyl-L-alanyl-D-glutamate--2,6-diaminopimelate ligase [Anaerolinea sp.]|nr:UDP-N-acetylmuramoyl-L-alanyl-D-glutamate--2,6-diaminopimelate ligase [Anaerolinea sp.]